MHPGLPDVCDAMNVDDDCNGIPNDPPGGCMCTGTESRPCTAVGVCAAGTESCSGGSWGSCSIAPVAEVCDGRDEDCDGEVDDGTLTTCFADGDGDGYAASGAAATPLCPASGGFGGCPTGYTTRVPVGATMDCDDTTYATSPAGTEVCNGIDDDCDGTADEMLRVTCYLDVDNDTYSAAGASATSQCADPTRTMTGLCPLGYTHRAPSPADCDDLAPGRSPAAVEVCDMVDQDCDGMVDETVAVPCYEDVDGDGYAASGATSSQQCRDASRPARGYCPLGYTDRAPTATSYDCGPTNAAINPDATETCSLPPVDEDCDGMANPSSVCSCGDGMVRACTLPGVCSTGTEQCSGGTWSACSVMPVTETCDGRDEDCDGTADEGLTVTCYADGDNDTYAGAGASPTPLCPVAGRGAVGGCPLDYTNRAPGTTTTDCNDTRADVSPAGVEVCSDTGPAADENCDGTVDEGLRVTCYADGDGDTYAPSTSTSTSRCRDESRGSVGYCPAGYTNRAPGAGTTDCADDTAGVNPGRPRSATASTRTARPAAAPPSTRTPTATATPRSRRRARAGSRATTAATTSRARTPAPPRRATASTRTARPEAVSRSTRTPTATCTRRRQPPAPAATRGTTAATTTRASSPGRPRTSGRPTARAGRRRSAARRARGTATRARRCAAAARPRPRRPSTTTAAARRASSRSRPARPTPA
ncbi:MAG: putative metal-binding motif-containing protein [Sandaracinaceae bacterium]|nr:putative metal-binding motif-containing protein [Sandaracinaceae bacterium]